MAFFALCQNTLSYLSSSIWVTWPATFHAYMSLTGLSSMFCTTRPYGRKKWEKALKRKLAIFTFWHIVSHIHLRLEDVLFAWDYNYGSSTMKLLEHFLLNKIADSRASFRAKIGLNMSHKWRISGYLVSKLEKVVSENYWVSSNRTSLVRLIPDDQ